MGVAAHLEAATLSVAPGAEAMAEIRVRNTGKIVDQVSIDVVGDPRPWSTPDPPVLSLLPGDEGTARIHFRPPRTPYVPAGRMPFGVRARSQQDPAASVVEEGAIFVEPFFESAADLSPRSQRARGPASYRVAIENGGNSTIEAALTPIDPERNLDFEVRPPVPRLEPGMGAAARLVVKPRRQFWAGPTRTHSFRVVVETPGTPEVALDGTLLQEARLPPWAERVAPTALRIMTAFVRSLPILVFVGVLIPLAVRLGAQVVTLTEAAPGSLLRSYTDLFVFGGVDLPGPLRPLDPLDLIWGKLPLGASTTWQVFVWVLVWGVIWLVLLALSRLVRR